VYHSRDLFYALAEGNEHYFVASCFQIHSSLNVTVYGIVYLYIIY
jgi:hypothetical protein